MTGIPGVVSDGANGEIIQGGIQVNGLDPVDNPGDTTPFSSFIGFTAFRDSPLNQTNGYGEVQISEYVPLAADSPRQALTLWRGGALNGHQYTGSIARLFDETGSTAPFLDCYNGGGQVFIVNQAGGIGVYGHAAPAAQPTPTIATSTITDAVAKAAIKALILIINNSGLAAITET